MILPLSGKKRDFENTRIALNHTQDFGLAQSVLLFRECKVLINIKCVGQGLAVWKCMLKFESFKPIIW